MSILQEYNEIKSILIEGEFEAMQKFLEIRNDLLISDLFYNEKHYNSFLEWWQEVLSD